MNVFDDLKREILRAEQSGLTRHLLARQSGLTEHTIRCWINGPVQAPRLPSMVAVAQVLGKHIELTGDVAKMAGYFPPPVPPQPKPRFQLWRLS